MLSILFQIFKENIFFVHCFFCLILFLPFFSAFGLGFRSFYLCIYDTPVLYSLILIWLSFEGSFVLFDYLINSGFSIFLIQGFSWFETKTLVVNWTFQIDYLSLIMFMVVTLISWLVHFYSVGYMELDPKFQLFFAYLSLFTFFMLILVSAGNLIQLFIGWEGVGLCSFLLISFWNTRILANKAALKAMIINKIGDYFLLLGIVFVVLSFGTVSFIEFYNCLLYYNFSFFIIFNWNISLLNIISFFFF